MDQSDILRARQAKAIYSYYKTTKLVQQPNCNTTTCSSINGCVVNYPSYAERQQVTAGSAACNGCSNTACGCSG